VEQIEALRATLPDAARDAKLNIQAVLRPEKLTAQQTWGAALTAAYYLRDKPLIAAVAADAQAAGLSDDAADDAKAAASLMGMTTVYYRFRHLLGKAEYQSLSPRLRMSRMSSPKTSRLDYEAFALTAAILGACEGCIKSHEKALLDGGFTPDQVNDLARIAAAMHAMSVSLAIAG